VAAPAARPPAAAHVEHRPQPLPQLLQPEGLLHEGVGPVLQEAGFISLGFKKKMC